MEVYFAMGNYRLYIIFHIEGALLDPIIVRLQKVSVSTLFAIALNSDTNILANNGRAMRTCICYEACRHYILSKDEAVMKT